MQAQDELRLIVLSVAFRLHKFVQELPSFDVKGDDGPLRFETEAALRLPVRRDAKVGDDGGGVMRGRCSVS